MITIKPQQMAFFSHLIFPMVNRVVRALRLIEDHGEDDLDGHSGADLEQLREVGHFQNLLDCILTATDDDGGSFLISVILE